MTPRMTADRSGDENPQAPARPGPAGAAGCELCEAAPITRWWHADDLCWIADCEACDSPMVVWRRHGAEPPPDEVTTMLERLATVADARFGPGGYRVDRVMRQIPDHFHAHARDRSRSRSLFAAGGS